MAHQANADALADHMREMVGTVSTAWKTGEAQLLTAAKARDLAIAAAKRDLAAGGTEAAYTTAVASAQQSYSNATANINPNFLRSPDD